MPILGNVAEVFVALSDGSAGNIAATEADRAGSSFFEARQAINEFRLAVAIDPGQADDLTSAHIKAHALDGVVLVHSGGHHQVFHTENGIPRLCLALDDLQLNGAAHHHIAQVLLIRITGVHRADALALAQDGDAVGHGHDLVELVGDKENGFALFGKALHGGHELFDFLGVRTAVGSSNIRISLSR